MRYIVKLWDKTSFKVPESAGKQIMDAKMAGIKTIKVGDAMYETKAIAMVEPIKEEPKNLLPERSEDPVKKETLSRVKKEISERFKWN